MKLEFLKDVNEYGDDVMRLYDFDKTEAALLQKEIQETVITKNLPLDLSKLEFIESLNCKLILHIADEDEGILTQDEKTFFCDLTIDGYRNMIRLIEPYTKKELRSFQNLYELDTEIDFIFSPQAGSAL